VWHLEPSLTDPDTVYAGVEDAAIFRYDGRRPELAGAARTARPPSGPTGSRARAGCACTRSSSTRESRADLHRHLAAGAFRTDDARQTWRPINRGLKSRHPRSERRGRPLRPPHRDAPVAPGLLFMQKHWDVMRSDDAGESWPRSAATCRPTSASRSTSRARAGTDLRRPDQERLEHFRRRQAARLPQPHRRQRVGAADEGSAAARLLRQRAARRHGGRLARFLRRVFGTTGGQVYASADAGDTWSAVVRDLAPGPLG
jgi:hypothetical protein